jgi:3'-5' exoribonuclease
MFWLLRSHVYSLEQAVAESAKQGTGKRKYVAQLSDGDQVRDVFLVTDCQERTTKDGSPYLTMVLADKTGSIKAILWNYSPGEQEISRDQFVEVNGVVGTYNNKLQLRLLSVAPYPEEKVSIDDFLRKTDKDVEKLLGKIASILSDIRDPLLDALMKSFLSDEEFMSAFRRAPAAHSMHHPYIGGLLEHTHNTVRVCKALSLIYPQVDADLIVAGAFIHDIGKIMEYEYSRSFNFSTVGRLKTHMLLGCEMLREHISRIEGFPGKLAVKLEHIILSHHGQKDWGAPVEPLFIEAALLHFADNLDAKAFMFDQARRNAAEGDEWSPYSRELLRFVYLD